MFRRSRSRSPARSPVRAPSPAPSAAPPLRAIITLVSSDSFVTGARVLAHSLRSVGSSAPLYVMITPSVSASARAELALAGFNLLLVTPLQHANPHRGHVSSWDEVGYTKLRIWSLTQFDRLLYIDADCVVEHNVDHLLGHAMDGVTFAAAPDTFPPDRFNAGVMLLRPDARVFASMLRRMSGTQSYDGGDTGFLNAFFRRWFLSPNVCAGPAHVHLDEALQAVNSATTTVGIPVGERAETRYKSGVCRLSFGYNALRTMQWFTKKAPAYWGAIHPLYISHMCSSPKPWEDLEQRRGGPLEQRWFQLYDAMVAAERETREKHAHLAARLPLEFVATPSGGLRPSLASQRSVGDMPPFQALQTLVAANIDNMPLGELRWVGGEGEHAAKPIDFGKTAREEESQAGEGERKQSVEARSEEQIEAEGAASSRASRGRDRLMPPSPTSGRSRSPSPLGCLRPVRRGVWVSPDREDRFLATTRRTLHACILHALENPSHSCMHFGHRGIPKRIHQIWLGGPLPDRFRAWSESWLRFHSVASGWEYTLWTDADLGRFPLSEQLTDASSAFLASHLKSLLPRCTSHAQRSDLLRLDILWTLGGLYVDTDFSCLTDFSPLHDGGAWGPFLQFYVGLANTGAVELNNGLMAAVPQHGLVGKLIQSIDLPKLGGAATAGSGGGSPARTHHSASEILSSSGPGHLTRTMVSWTEEWESRWSDVHSPQHCCTPRPNVPPALALPAQVFYPLPNNMRHLTSEEDKRHFVTPASFAMHHWACSWQKQSESGAEDDKPVSSAVRAQQDATLTAIVESIARLQVQAAKKVAQTAVSSSSSSSSSTSEGPHVRFAADTSQREEKHESGGAASPQASTGVSPPPSTSTAVTALDPALLRNIAAFLK